MVCIEELVTHYRGLRLRGSKLRCCFHKCFNLSLNTVKINTVVYISKENPNFSLNLIVNFDFKDEISCMSACGLTEAISRLLWLYWFLSVSFSVSLQKVLFLFRRLRMKLHLHRSPRHWLLNPAGWHRRPIHKPSSVLTVHTYRYTLLFGVRFMECGRTWAWPWWASGGTCAQWGPSESPGWSARGSGAPCESPPQAGGTRSLHLWMGRSNEGEPRWLKGGNENREWRDNFHLKLLVFLCSQSETRINSIPL